MNWKTAILAFMLLGPVLGCASEYQFGTKVLTSDSDMGKPLLLAGPLTGVFYWNIGPAGFDEGDPVYLHLGVAPGSGATIVVNDVRLTPFGDLAAGSKVTSTDNDVGMPLVALPTAAIKYMDHFGSGTPAVYDLEDPVYLDAITPSFSTVLSDIRLTSVSGLQAGTHIRDSDSDLNKFYTPPILVIGAFQWSTRIRWDDVNGNGYDYPDDVYMERSGAAAVSVNDVRLSGP